MAIPNVPKQQPRTFRDYSPPVTRLCPVCLSSVFVFDNAQDWRLSRMGCGGRYC